MEERVRDGGWLATTAIGVLLWLPDGVKLVVDGLHAALDTALYWRDYRIAVSAPGLDCSAAGEPPAADQLGRLLARHWASVTSWTSAPDFTAFAQPRIRALVTAGSSDWAEKVIEDMDVVGPTWRAFSGWVWQLQPFLQDWVRHGEGLVLRPDYTGELSYRTYIEPDPGQSMWFEHDTLKLSVSPDGRTLTAVVTGMGYDAGQSQAVPPPSSHAHVGDTYAFTIKPGGALNMHQVRPPAAAGSDDLALCTSGSRTQTAAPDAGSCHSGPPGGAVGVLVGVPGVRPPAGPAGRVRPALAGPGSVHGRQHVRAPARVAGGDAATSGWRRVPAGRSLLSAASRTSSTRPQMRRPSSAARTGPATR